MTGISCYCSCLLIYTFLARRKAFNLSCLSFPQLDHEDNNTFIRSGGLCRLLYASSLSEQ